MLNQIYSHLNTVSTFLSSEATQFVQYCFYEFLISLFSFRFLDSKYYVSGTKSSTFNCKISNRKGLRTYVSSDIFNLLTRSVRRKSFSPLHSFSQVFSQVGPLFATRLDLFIVKLRYCSNWKCIRSVF